MKKTKGRSGAPSQRQYRVGEELRHVIAHILDRAHFRDPDLVGVSVACEGVDFSIHGLQFRTAAQIPVGSRLNITIGIGEPFAMFLLSGETRWVRERDGDSYAGILLSDQPETDYHQWCERFDEIFAS